MPFQGRNARGSATYHDNVAAALASVFHKAFQQDRQPEQSSPEGLESLLVNDVLASSSWDVLAIGVGQPPSA